MISAMKNLINNVEIDVIDGGHGADEFAFNITSDSSGDFIFG